MCPTISCRISKFGGTDKSASWPTSLHWRRASHLATDLNKRLANAAVGGAHLGVHFGKSVVSLAGVLGSRTRTDTVVGTSFGVGPGAAPKLVPAALTSRRTASPGVTSWPG